MKQEIRLKSNALKDKDLEILYNTDNFYVAVVRDVSPFLVLDEIPNYFIFNAQTAKIEAMSNSLVAAKTFIKFAEEAGEGGVEDISEKFNIPKLN